MAQGNLQIRGELSNQFYALVIISGFDRHRLHQTSAHYRGMLLSDQIYRETQRMRVIVSQVSR